MLKANMLSGAAWGFDSGFSKDMLTMENCLLKLSMLFQTFRVKSRDNSNDKIPIAALKSGPSRLNYTFNYI